MLRELSQYSVSPLSSRHWVEWFILHLWVVISREGDFLFPFSLKWSVIELQSSSDCFWRLKARWHCKNSFRTEELVVCRRPIAACAIGNYLSSSFTPYTSYPLLLSSRKPSSTSFPAMYLQLIIQLFQVPHHSHAVIFLLHSVERNMILRKASLRSVRPLTAHFVSGYHTAQGKRSSVWNNCECSQVSGCSIQLCPTALPSVCQHCRSISSSHLSGHTP